MIRKYLNSIIVNVLNEVVNVITNKKVTIDLGVYYDRELSKLKARSYARGYNDGIDCCAEFIKSVIDELEGK